MNDSKFFINGTPIDGEFFNQLTATKLRADQERKIYVENEVAKDRKKIFDLQEDINGLQDRIRTLEEDGKHDPVHSNDPQFKQIHIDKLKKILAEKSNDIKILRDKIEGKSAEDDEDEKIESTMKSKSRLSLDGVFVRDMKKYLESKTKTNTNFRVKNTMFHLTYNHIHIEPRILLHGIFRLLKKNTNITGFSIAHERGANAGNDEENPHTHFAFCLDLIFESRNPRIFDLKIDEKEYHPNVVAVNGAEQWKRIMEYHYKESCPYIFGNMTGDLIDRIWKYNSLEEMIYHECNERNIKMTNVYKTIFNAKPIVKAKFEIKEFRPWQQAILDMIDKEADDRTICWVWDPHGHSGKSLLMKYLATMVEGVFCTTISNSYHTSTEYKAYSDANGHARVIVMDFSRATRLDNIYSTLESLKNGCITTQKYSGVTTFFKSPHIIVFSNNMPDMYTNQLTEDRLQVITITGGMCVKHFFNKPCLDEWMSKNLKLIDPAFRINEFQKMIIKELEKPHYNNFLKMEDCLFPQVGQS